MDVADRLRPLIVALLGEPPPIEVRFWDGSVLTGDGTIGHAALLVIDRVDAARRKDVECMGLEAR